jgi:streptogramin lyase
MLLSISVKKANAQTWTIYNTTNSGMRSNNVAAIAFQQDTTAWVGLNSGGIIKFKNGVWNQVDTTIIFVAGSNFTDISCAPNNDVWITSINGTTIARQYKNAGGWIIHPFIFNSGINCVEIDPVGIVWIGNSTNGGLYKYNGQTFTVFNESNSNNPNDYVHGIGIVNDKKRWVCGTHEIGFMNDTTWTVFPFLALPWPIELDVAVENDTLVWFASTLGLVKFDGNIWTIYNNTNSGMPLAANNSFYSFPKLTVDKNGVKWMATKDFGLVKFDGTNWATYNITNSQIPSNNVQTVEIGKDNSVWAGTDKGLAIISNPIFPSALNNSLFQVKISIFPNPSSDIIFITGVDEKSQNEVCIYDVKGKLTNCQKFKTEVNIKTLIPGTYFLEISNSKERIIKQFMKK